MAIVTFECDTCKRKIDKPQNKKGLEVIGRCVITEGCKGNLHRVGFSADHVTGKQTPPVEGLTDWSQRKVIYTHNQNTLADSWKVKHWLNNNPSVQVFIQTSSIYPDQIEEVEPESVTYDNSNELTVYLSSKHKGIAQCIALSTSKPKFDEEVVNVANNTLQLTTQSEITIATLDDSTNLDIEFTFLSPINLESLPGWIKTWAFDDTPAPLSTWNTGASLKVLINGKLYTVRSYPIDTNDLAASGIENGTPFYVSLVGGTVPENNDMFMLLTKPPYASVDININELIDVSNVVAANAATAFFYSKQELHAYETTKEPIYPPIRKTSA